MSRAPHPPRPVCGSYPQPSASPRSARGRGWAIGCSIAAAIVLTPLLMCAGVVGWLRSTDEAKAEAALDQARSAGDPITPEEMEAFYPSSPLIIEATGHWMRAIDVVDDPQFDQAGKGLPFVGDVEFDDDAPLPVEQRAAAKAFLETFKSAIEESHAARRSGSVARYPTDYALGYDMLLPKVQDSRSLTNVLHLDMEMNLVEGNVDAAVEDVLSLVAVGESLQNDPMFVSQLVRGAELLIAMQATEKLFRLADPTEAQLLRLQQAFARQRSAESLRKSFRGEQYLMIRAMRVKMPEQMEGSAWVGWLPNRGEDFAKTMEFWRFVMEAEKAGPLATLEASRRVGAEIDSLGSDNSTALQYPLTLLLMPHIEQAILAMLRAEAGARMAETACACERYRLAQNRWPARLDDLVPRYLTGQPVDPMDGQPLRYVVAGDRAKIYSVGWNQIDDGGLDDLRAGDAVFELIGE